MKKIIALLAAVALVLSLSACFMSGNTNSDSTEDQANAADVSTYDKDFSGLVQYIKDRNSNCEQQEIYYAILGAADGTRLVLNKNAYVEIYDFTDVLAGSATADSADPAMAQSIIDDIEDDGKFQPMANGVTMTAVITDSGKYVLAWDETRSFDYAGKVATDELKENW